ncbi:MAG TPA: hypothetical protein VGR48_06455 [Terriglobales bacterium]|nr:hypothetical protein [Terriglobales bacterium]
MLALLRLDAYTTTAALAVFTYYAAAWALIAHAPRQGTIVPLYDPPQQLSPAGLRYAWKRRFDDRTFWAAVLSLVSKGLATMKSDSGGAILHLAPSADGKALLPEEERLLFDKVQAHPKGKGVRINMLDEGTADLAGRMSDVLRDEASGVWFQDNRTCVLTGTAFSAIVVLLAAKPSSADEWFALGLSFAVMAPAAYYLPFLLLRIRDLFRTVRAKLDLQVLCRAAAPLMWVLPCVAGIVLGCIELGGTFGGLAVGVTAVMAALDVAFLHFLRTPTQKGRQLLDEIEGFRLFLQEVDRSSLNQPDAPGEHPGTYEKYLPYAVALEVEQAWGDRFVALASTVHRAESVPNTESFYLGMWDGKPVEIIYAPQPARRF